MWILFSIVYCLVFGSWFKFCIIVFDWYRIFEMCCCVGKCMFLKIGYYIKFDCFEIGGYIEVYYWLVKFGVIIDWIVDKIGLIDYINWVIWFSNILKDFVDFEMNIELVV